MKNFGKKFKQIKQGQFKRFYQGTGTFYTGTYAGLVSHTQKVVPFNEYDALLSFKGGRITS